MTIGDIHKFVTILAKLDIVNKPHASYILYIDLKQQLYNEFYGGR